MKLCITSLVAVAVLTACAGKTEHAADAAPHWGYEGETGPEQWAALDPAFASCSAGQSQSPVNIAGTVDVELPAITFRYTSAAHEILHNGHTVQVGVQPGSAIELGGRNYGLKQFHFHAPSEHQVDGRTYPLEAHFVHADSSGALAVVGVLFEEGQVHEALEAVWKNLPQQAGPAQPLESPAAPEALLPSARDYYHLSGSLTTPPCSEGVRWLVMKRSLTASAEQISRFSQAVGHGNSRPVQPLNGRTIEQ